MMPTRTRLTDIGFDVPLSVERFDLAEPGAGQVLIAVEACGVCYRDLIDRSGRFPFIQLPITPGHEAAGRVIAVGPGVTRWRVGDRVATMHRDYCGECVSCRAGQTSLCDSAVWVFGLMTDGGYATHVVATERALYALPDDLDPALAAVLHCTFGTAYRGLMHHAPVGASTRVLVTGANGGVGMAGVQLARRMGADVVAVVRGDQHLETLQSLGAREVIVDDGTTFHKKLGGWRADVVLDCVGQPTFNASLRSLRIGGGMTVIGNVRQEAATLNLGYLIVAGIRLVGSSGATAGDMEGVLALHRQQPLASNVDRIVPLVDAESAQQSLRTGGLQGRIVLMPAAPAD
jgi:D-arabinose 1-dehydrogenase-like Zn-dependent alcohol dehydrogenase